jgi:hypothetical protein
VATGNPERCAVSKPAEKKKKEERKEGKKERKKESECRFIPFFFFSLGGVLAAYISLQRTEAPLARSA